METGRALRCRLLAFEPGNLGRHVAGVRVDASCRAQFRRVDDSDVRRRTSIHPNEAGTERLPTGVHGHAAIQLTGNAKRRDFVFGNAGAGNRFSDGRADGRVPHRRVLLGPAGPGVDRLIGFRGFAKETKVRVEDDGLETLSADIDADYGDGLISRGSGASGQNID